jgi:hypothetical protein
MVTSGHDFLPQQTSLQHQENDSEVGVPLPFLVDKELLQYIL